MKTSEIVGKKILLLGYGREGKGTHRYLQDAYPDITMGIADKNPVHPLFPVGRIITGKNYLSALQSFTTVVRSPGIPTHLKEIEEYRDSGGNITSATNLFFSLCPGTTIGVTGTKGKSTTSALIAAILKTISADVRLVGNIGKPMLGELDGATKKTIFVIELSSHQLEDARFSPHVAVVLNIVPEHLDYYDSFTQYVQAKKNVVSFQNDEDVVVYNPNNKTVVSLIKNSNGKRVMFSMNRNNKATAWVESGAVMMRGGGNEAQPVVNMNKVALLGNQENMLAAITVGGLFGVPARLIKRAVSQFQPLSDRLEFVGEFNGIKFFNDSLATVPEATIHALHALGQEVVTLVAGGYDRGIDYKNLGKFIVGETSVKTLILFPDTGEKIWAAVQLAGAKRGLRRIDVHNMKEAVNDAYKYTEAGKICLLSPASASYNLFADHHDRGEQFKNAVQQSSRAPH